MPNVQQVEAAVSERDFLASRTPVGNLMLKLIAIENLVDLQSSGSLVFQKLLTAECAEKSGDRRGSPRPKPEACAGCLAPHSMLSRLRRRARDRVKQFLL